MTSSATELERRALDALREARAHKRLVQRHRRAAQLSMRRYERLRRELAALGIKLIINGEAPEGGTHGRSAAAEQLAAR